MENLKFDKNAKKIIIPEGKHVIDFCMFKGYDKVEEIVLPESITIIDSLAFMNCSSLKKINLPKNLTLLERGAFYNCTSLEEITIPENVKYISEDLFFNCKNLKKVNTHDNIKYISDHAFYGCENLKDFKMPKKLEDIGDASFFECKSISEINIPPYCKNIEDAAFGKMTSLEKITVDENNNHFYSLNNNTTLISKGGHVIQYACNNKSKKINLGYYDDDLGGGFTIKSLIYSIGAYAFNGAKNLKYISINAELSHIGSKAFENCENLKTLKIFYTPFGKTYSVYFPTLEYDFPFKNIIIDEGIKVLCSNLSDLFKNAEHVKLPKSLETISSNVFSKSSNLKRIKIPDSIKTIQPLTFHPETTLKIDFLGNIKGKDLNIIYTKTTENAWICKKRDDSKIYSLKDGTYYVKMDGFDTIKITKDDILKFYNGCEYIADNPDIFILYLHDLLSINTERNNLIIDILTNQELKKIFTKFQNDNKYIQDIVNKKIAKRIKELMKINNVEDEFLFNSLIIKNCNKEDIKKLLINYNPSLKRFFKFYETSNFLNMDLNIDKIINYCNLLEKYKKYDRFLYNPIFYNISLENQELLIKNYNKNMKRLLIESELIQNNSYLYSLNDLIKLCKVLGAFSDNKILSQKITTFIIEKLICNKNINLKEGRIHAIFDSLRPKDDINYEFINFFIDNYNELFELEKEKTGIIVRIYNSFDEISKSNTSNKGNGRHLKVTIEKCLNFFLLNCFDGITDNNKDLAKFLNKYYSERYILNIAEKILEQSKNAPRNIFTKIEFDKNNNPIYNYDESLDLKEDINKNYSFEWLPKQNYDNLILGKYCNCCAHLLGAGAGIMRASMILNSCQNLVIRNESGEIIAKMTIYVNRKKGYAVFNTAEINLQYIDTNNINKIYKAFMRGTKEFIKVYNKNNIIPIKTVTIGNSCNDFKEKFENKETIVLDTPNFSDYGYYADGKRIGTHNGDSKKKQLLVLKR